MGRAVAERANPYSPPDDYVPHELRSSAGVASILVVVLVLVLALRLFRATLYLAGLVDDGSFRVAVQQPLDVSWRLTWPLLVIAMVSFCAWIYRANRDVRVLGAEAMSFSPGWSVAIGFVPVANLIGPYRAVKEIRQASDPSRTGGGWIDVAVPAVLPLWWGFWLASIFWNLASRDFAPVSMLWPLLVAEALRAAAALLLIAVVRDIDGRIAEKAKVVL